MEYALFTADGYTTMINKVYTIDIDKIIFYDEISDTKSFSRHIKGDCYAVPFQVAESILNDFKAGLIGTGDVLILSILKGQLV